MSCSVFSQKVFKPGIRMGINNTNISKLDSERSFGYYLGVLYPVKIGKNKTMQIELTYDYQNTKLINNSTLMSSICDISDPNSCFVEEIKMSLVTASLTYNFVNKEKFQVLAGPFLSVIINENFNQYQPGMFNFSPLTDAGLFAGAGYKFSQKLILELRFKKGFDDVIRVRENNTNNQTNTFQLGLVYNFINK